MPDNEFGLAIWSWNVLGYTGLLTLCSFDDDTGNSLSKCDGFFFGYEHFANFARLRDAILYNDKVSEPSNVLTGKYTNCIVLF